LNRVENVEGYRIVHIIPDLSDEDKEELKQGIVLRIHKLLQGRSIKTPDIF
jgi:hypothetical protein